MLVRVDREYHHAPPMIRRRTMISEIQSTAAELPATPAAAEVEAKSEVVAVVAIAPAPSAPAVPVREEPLTGEVAPVPEPEIPDPVEPGNEVVDPVVVVPPEVPVPVDPDVPVEETDPPETPPPLNPPEKIEPPETPPPVDSPPVEVVVGPVEVNASSASGSLTFPAASVTVTVQLYEPAASSSIVIVFVPATAVVGVPVHEPP
jgi:hypothetical protein